MFENFNAHKEWTLCYFQKNASIITLVIVPAVINEVQEDGVNVIESVTTYDAGKIIHKNSKIQDPAQVSQ